MGDEWHDPELKRAVDRMLESANLLCIVHSRELNDDIANYIMGVIGQLRDTATLLLPPEEDFGGSNVVPFRLRQVN